MANEYVAWNDPNLDELAAIRQRILAALDLGTHRDDFATALSEVLANAVEACIRSGTSEPIAIAISRDSVSVTNIARTPVTLPDHMPDPGAIRGRGIFVASSLWPDTDWSVSGDYVTATMGIKS